MIKTVNTANKQNGKFIKGISGNPKGRPKGALNKSTKIALELMQEDLELITQALIDEAKKGNLQAIKLILDKLIPNAKETPLPALDIDTLTRQKLFDKLSTLLATGTLTASQLNTFTELLKIVEEEDDKNILSLF